VQKFILFIVFLIAINPSIVLAESDFNCTITGVSEVTADGHIEALAGKKNYYETAIGAEFIVQREKGLMAGRFVSNTGWKINVIDQGSAQQSYKSLSNKASGRVQSQFLEIRIQEKSDKKPFILLATEILHGYCTM
jgi:hypothetical protein